MRFETMLGMKTILAITTAAAMGAGLLAGCEAGLFSEKSRHSAAEPLSSAYGGHRQAQNDLPKAGNPANSATLRDPTPHPYRRPSDRPEVQHQF
jgi:hypothetical protein